jgi:hypothetical protein
VRVGKSLVGWQRSSWAFYFGSEYGLIAMDRVNLLDSEDGGNLGGTGVGNPGTDGTVS